MTRSHTMKSGLDGLPVNWVLTGTSHRNIFFKLYHILCIFQPPNAPLFTPPNCSYRLANDQEQVRKKALLLGKRLMGKKGHLSITIDDIQKHSKTMMALVLGRSLLLLSVTHIFCWKHITLRNYSTLVTKYTKRNLFEDGVQIMSFWKRLTSIFLFQWNRYTLTNFGTGTIVPNSLYPADLGTVFSQMWKEHSG